MVPVFSHIASPPVCGNAICLLAAVLALFAGTEMYGSNRHARQDEVRFMENRGQWPDQVRFAARIDGSAVWVTDSSVVYDHRNATDGHVVAMELAGTSAPVVRGDNALEGNYTFITKERSVATRSFGSLLLQQVYEGVDMIVRADGGGVRYDFILAPHASPEAISIRFEGVEAHNMSVDSEGLALRLSTGTIRHGSLFAYQTISGTTIPVDCRFSIRNNGTIGFSLGEYNKNYTLVIDPLVFSGILGGGNNEVVQAITADSTGSIYAAGYTNSLNFPTTPGAYRRQLQNSGNDIFVTKLDPTGRRLLYSTYICGAREDMATAIAVTGAGEAVLTGSTTSADFPTTNNAIDPGYNGSSDAFYALLGPKGDSLLYATYIGGGGEDIGTDLALRGDTVYITGETRSDSLFPRTPDALQPFRSSAQDAFLIMLNTAGTRVHYGSYVGGNSVDVANSIAVRADGMVALAGRTSSTNLPVSATAVKKERQSSADAFDAFIVQFNPVSRELVYCTYFGGSGNDEQVETIRYNSAGDLVAGGWTNSTDFPVTTGGFDTAAAEPPYHSGFLAVLSPDKGLLAATYLGGTRAATKIFDIALDSSDNIFCTGITYSNSFPVTPDAFDGSYNLPSNGDGFMSYMAGNLDTLLYSTYFGGSEIDAVTEVHAGPYRTAIVAGYTRSPDIPVQHGLPFSGNTDGFVASFSMGAIIAAPNGGEMLCAGSGFLIEWLAGRQVQTVSLVAQRPGYEAVVLASGIPADEQQWWWQIPDDLPGGSWRIRILDEKDRLLDVSDTTFIVRSHPVFAMQPVDAQKCPGNNVVLECVAHAFPLPSYQWQKYTGGTWVDIPGETSRFLTIYGLNPAVHNGLYRAKVSTECGHTMYSDSARISTYPQPVIDMHPLPAAVCPGTTVSFRARSADPQASIQWEYRMADSDTWNILHGETTEELIIHNVTDNHNGWEYRAIFHNLCDNKTTAARLTVHPFPSVSGHPVPDTVCAGERAKFSITTSTQDATVQWQMSRDLEEWQDIPSATALAYTTGPINESNSGMYFRALVRNGCQAVAISQAAQAVLAPVPLYELTSQTLDFGTLGFCTDDSVLSIGITNSGTEPLAFGTPVQDNTHFGVQDTPLFLAPGLTDSITVRFAPTSVPVEAESVLYLPVGECGYRIPITLRGNKATAPVVSTISFVDFGTVAACLPEPVDTVIRIINTGSVAITLYAGMAGPPFEVSSTRPFPVLLQPAESIHFDLRYTPSASEGSDMEFVLFPFATASGCSDTLKVQAYGKRERPLLSIADTVYFPLLPSCSTGIDTVLRIVNTGRVPVRIGPDALLVGEAFIAGYPTEEVVLHSGEILSLPVTFRPTADGAHEGSLSFAYAPCGTTYTIEFRGRSATPGLAANTSTLVFSRTVRTRTVAFTNTGILPLSLASIEADIPGYSVLVAPGLPLALAPNESLWATVEYTGPGDPQDAVLQAVSDSPCTLVVPVDIKGDVPPVPVAHIAVPVLHRKLGEVFSLPLIVDTAAIAALHNAGVMSFRADVAFNATMMTPVDPSQRGGLQNGRHVIRVEGLLSSRRADTLLAVQMTAALGNASYTPVDIQSFLWLGSSGNPMAISTEIQQGGLYITNVKKGQHINLSSPFSISIAPVPADETLTIAIERIPSLSGVSLEVFDAAGVRVDDWTPALTALPGSAAGGFGGTIYKNINALAAGVYYCRLSLWNFSLVRPFVVR